MVFFANFEANFEVKIQTLEITLKYVSISNFLKTLKIQILNQQN